MKVSVAVMAALLLVLAVGAAKAGAADGRPAVASPMEQLERQAARVTPRGGAFERQGFVSSENLDSVEAERLRTASSAQLASGGARLVELQQNDGGWDWPLDDGDPDNPSPPNTVGPIAMGLAQAYAATGDAAMAAALQQAGGFLLAKTVTFTPSDGYLAAELDRLFGGTTYVDHLNTYFYGPLAAGTYDRNAEGTLYDTAAYVDLIRSVRASQGIANLAAWDVGIGVVGAASSGVTGADLGAWVTGTKAEIDELDGSAYYDVIGLAGAVFALAHVGEDFDPTAGEHAAASSLSDLVDILLSYQITESGGFTWNSAYVIPYDDNETIQETAYAVLALREVGGHEDAVAAAVAYAESRQLPTGGWQNYTGAGENNEITGEALWAIALPVVRNVNTGASYATVEEAVAAATAGDTIELTDDLGVGAVVIDRDLTIRGGSVHTVYALADTGSSGDARAWFLVNPGVALHVEDLIFDGNGHLIYQAFRHKGTGSFTNCGFREIKFNESGPTYAGVAIAAFGDPGNPVDVTACTFSEIGRVGVLYFGAGVNGSVYDGNTYTGKGDGDFLDYGVELGGGAVAAISNSSITGCRGVASTDGSTSAGMLLTTYFGAGTAGTITGNTLTGNHAGIIVGYDETDTSSVVAHRNAISGNATGLASHSVAMVDAELNWWGDVTGPADASDDAGEVIGVDRDACTASPAAEINDDGLGNSVQDNSSAVVDYCPWLMTPFNALALEAAACQDDAFPAEAGHQVVVELWMRSLTQVITGYEAYVQYDTGVLSYRGDLSSYVIFTAPLFAIDQADDGLLDLAAAVPLAGSGTDQDSLLATLVFTTNAGACLADLWFEVGGPWPSVLSYQGVAVSPMTTIDLSGLSVDSATPVIDVCPADPTIVECDGAGNTAELNAWLDSFAAHDDCGAVVLDNDFTALSDECGETGSATVTYTATDECGWQSTCVSTFTIADSTPPVLTGCPAPEITVECDAVPAPAVVDASDDCNGLTLSFEEVRTDGPCEDTYTLTRTWTATDDCGHEDSCQQIINVQDTTPPAISDCPDDITVNADTGGCAATVTWTPPTATDDCGAVTVDSTHIPGEVFAGGTTTVSYTFTDDCGNFAVCDFDVTVNEVTTVNVDVELVGVVLPVTRCIRFVTTDCDSFVDVSLDFVDNGGSSVSYIGAIEVPCGAWATLCAKDQQHSLYHTAALIDQVTHYDAATVLSLAGGDTDNDSDVDIHDITWLLYQYGEFAAGGSCPWDGSRDADFSNNGVVGAEDYTFLTTNWHDTATCPCSVATPDAGLAEIEALGRKAVLRVEELSPEVASWVDLNADGLVDYRDVQAFEAANGLPNDLSAKMIGNAAKAESVWTVSPAGSPTLRQ